MSEVVQALVMGGKAALTQLGRNRAGDAHVKHHIKAVDRLLGNCHLHREWAGVYRAIALTLLAKLRRPVLVVDWSDFERGDSRKWAMIKAAVPVGGRAVVVYSRGISVQALQFPERPSRVPARTQGGLAQ